MKLEGVAAMVIGGGGIVGRTIALTLAREGADVAIVTLKSVQEEAVKEIKKLGRRAIALHGDITDKESVDSTVTRTVEALGKIDLLVNNAGMIIRAPLERVSVEDWDKVVAVNLKGVFLYSVAVAKQMMKQKKGNIINVAGATAHRCFPGAGAFAPSKAGVVNLTKQMAVEWAKYNIRVNGVSPGPIMTPETEQLIKDEDMKQRIAKIPLGRVAKPEEIANVIVFLASEDSSYITGQVLIVDGGGVETWWLYP